MAEACLCSFTTPTQRCEVHHAGAEFVGTHVFPARLKAPFINNSPSLRLPLSCAHKGHSTATSSPAAGFGKRKKKIEDDPWEALFQQLEKDLENDMDDTSEEEITEEDVANLEKELNTIFQDLEDASTDDSKASELDEALKVKVGEDHVKGDGDHKKGGITAKQSNKDGHDEGNLHVTGETDNDNDEEAIDEQADYDDEDFSDDDHEEPRTVRLQKWQLRKLAAAAELGRRKVNIKSLAAELKLDRDDVIYFLKSPPPELLMALSRLEEDRDEDDESVSDQDEASADTDKVDDSLVTDVLSIDTDTEMLEAKEQKKQNYGPRDWYKGKRIKKSNIMTLQRVYKRTRWPTNTMIESLVQATHLPRARVLEWFEEERAKAGVESPPRQSDRSRKAWRRPVTNSFERLQ